MGKNSGRSIQTIFVMTASLLCVLIGGVFLFAPQMGANNICYICCVGMIIWGVAQIAKYFVTEAYRRLHDYSFASGVMFLILGCCGLVRAKDIVENQEVFLGLAILAIGIVLLQCAIQLKLVNSKVWIMELTISLLIILCAILVLANVSFLMEHIRGFAYWVLMIAGIVNMISFPTVAIMVHKDKNRVSKDIDEFTDEELLDDDRYETLLKQRQEEQNIDYDEEWNQEGYEIEVEDEQGIDNESQNTKSI